jgi:hypothetical protein
MKLTRVRVFCVTALVAFLAACSSAGGNSSALSATPAAADSSPPGTADTFLAVQKFVDAEDSHFAEIQRRLHQAERRDDVLFVLARASRGGRVRRLHLPKKRATGTSTASTAPIPKQMRAGSRRKRSRTSPAPRPAGTSFRSSRCRGATSPPRSYAIHRTSTERTSTSARPTPVTIAST